MFQQDFDTYAVILLNAVNDIDVYMTWSSHSYPHLITSPLNPFQYGCLYTTYNFTEICLVFVVFVFPSSTHQHIKSHLGDFVLVRIASI